MRFNNGGGIYLAENKDSRETVVIKEARPKVGYDGNGHDAEHRLNIEHTILDRLKGINCKFRPTGVNISFETV